MCVFLDLMMSAPGSRGVILILSFEQDFTHSMHIMHWLLRSIVWGNSPTGQAIPASVPIIHSFMSWSAHVFFDLHRSSMIESMEKTPSTSPIGQMYLQKALFSNIAPITTASTVKNISSNAVFGGFRVNIKKWRSAANITRKSITAIQRLRYFSGYLFFRLNTDCVQSPTAPIGHAKHHSLPRRIRVKARRGCQISHIMVVANGIPPWKRRSGSLDRPK